MNKGWNKVYFTERFSITETTETWQTFTALTNIWLCLRQDTVTFKVQIIKSMSLKPNKYSQSVIIINNQPCENASLKDLKAENVVKLQHDVGNKWTVFMRFFLWAERTTSQLLTRLYTTEQISCSTQHAVAQRDELFYTHFLDIFGVICSI